MGNYQLLIALAVLVFMIISFLRQKISYGFTAMTCVVFLALTGVIDTKTAFSGFSHNTTILVATMMVVAGASIGSVMLLNFCHGPAPSMAAASRISVDILCKLDM